ncbi:MAG: hypothetical protein ACPGTU_09570 [Myxococcota bacterium]
MRMLLITIAALASCSVTNHGKETVRDTSAIPNPNIDSGQSEEVVDLVFFDQWVMLPESDDPYPDHRGDYDDCDPGGILPEDGVLEINTNDCGYAIVGQPLASDIVAGDWVELLMYHSALAAIDEPAEAHFSLWIGENLYWERTFAIPLAAEVYPVPITVDWSAEAGTPVRLHLHNHGGNSWRVGYLKRIR